MNPTENSLTSLSIIINNHNYGAFLGQAIDSALAQDYPLVELIVVDDGSTDDSAHIISSYGSKVISVFKANGGQGSAFNAGFECSTGDAVIFLDADDLLDAHAASTAVELLSTPGVVKAHWPLREIDAAGHPTGRLVPGRGEDLPHGDHRAAVRRYGPATMRFPPTSGNAWSREYLKRVLPMNEQIFPAHADLLLFEVAPFLGSMARSVQSLSSRRIHGSNISTSRTFTESLDRHCFWYSECVRVAADLCTHDTDDIEMPLEVSAWNSHGWWPRLRRAVESIQDIVPPQESIALIDDASWDLSMLGERPVLPVPMDSQGKWLGLPPTDTELLEALDRLAAKTHYVAIAWNAYWWLEYFPALSPRLGKPVLETPDIRIYRFS